MSSSSLAHRHERREIACFASRACFLCKPQLLAPNTTLSVTPPSGARHHPQRDTTLWRQTPPSASALPDRHERREIARFARKAQLLASDTTLLRLRSVLADRHERREIARFARNTQLLAPVTSLSARHHP
ncbi:unnamed protein product [Caenorhabditis brenneri]